MSKQGEDVRVERVERPDGSAGFIAYVVRMPSVGFQGEDLEDALAQLRVFLGRVEELRGRYGRKIWTL